MNFNRILLRSLLYSSTAFPIGTGRGRVLDLPIPALDVLSQQRQDEWKCTPDYPGVSTTCHSGITRLRRYPVRTEPTGLSGILSCCDRVIDAPMAAINTVTIFLWSSVIIQDEVRVAIT